MRKINPSIFFFNPLKNIFNLDTSSIADVNTYITQVCARSCYGASD